MRNRAEKHPKVPVPRRAEPSLSFVVPVGDAREDKVSRRTGSRYEFGASFVADFFALIYLLGRATSELRRRYYKTTMTRIVTPLQNGSFAFSLSRLSQVMQRALPR